MAQAPPRPDPLEDLAHDPECDKGWLLAEDGSVVACPICRPELFHRQAGGHLDPGHDRRDCPSCLATLAPPLRQGRQRWGRRTEEARPVENEEPPPPLWDERADFS